jgi:hypothetical protein
VTDKFQLPLLDSRERGSKFEEAYTGLHCDLYLGARLYLTFASKLALIGYSFFLFVVNTNIRDSYYAGDLRQAYIKEP